MALPSQLHWNDHLDGVELPEGVSFAHPEDGVSPQDEALLRAFLQEFEAHHEPLEGVGLFPADLDE